MKTFEDELLAELRTVVAEHAATPPRRTKRRVVLAVAACATLAAGTAVAVPIIGGEQTTSPAYSITKAADGTITVALYRYDDAEGFERRLAEVGVSAEADFLPPGMTCQTPRGEGFGGSVATVINGEATTFTLDPEEFSSATLVIEKSSFNSGVPQAFVMKVGWKKTETLLPCDARPWEPRTPIQPTK